MAEKQSFLSCTYTKFSSSVHRFQVSLQSLDIVWQIKGVPITLPDANFISFSYIFRSGTPGLYDKSIFNYLRILHTDFPKICPSLHSQQYIMIFITISVHLLFLLFFFFLNFWMTFILSELPPCYTFIYIAE